MNISIAMATYNGERYLREQIESILRQTLSDFELVISDDASSDGTWYLLQDYASKDKRIRIYRNDINVGFKENFVKAIGLCKGDYIALSDQDDIWEPYHLQVLADNIGDKMIACGDALMVNADNSSMNMLLSHQEALDFVPDNDLERAYSVFYFRSPYQGAGMLIKKDFFQIAFPIPDKIAYHDAWFSHLSCFYGGLRFIDIPISRYRRHDGNVTGNKIKRRPKLRTWFRHLRHQYTLVDRPYIARQIIDRVTPLSDEQVRFLRYIERYYLRKQNLWGRFLNSLFELSHYKLIYSCRGCYYI